MNQRWVMQFCSQLAAAAENKGLNMGEYVSFPRRFSDDEHYIGEINPRTDVATDPVITALSERAALASTATVAKIEYARRLLKARRTIAKVMPRKLFRDSAWDVMLELYIGTVEGSDVFVKQAIIASGECPATAMRIIARLDHSGFLQRRGDESDQRRVIVTLTDKGREAMELVLEQLGGELVH